MSSEWSVTLTCKLLLHRACQNLNALKFVQFYELCLEREFPLSGFLYTRLRRTRQRAISTTFQRASTGAQARVHCARPLVREIGDSAWTESASS
jgi:hypothetical protein